jgi:hypothetical protein
MNIEYASQINELERQNKIMTAKQKSNARFLESEKETGESVSISMMFNDML